MSQSSSHKHVKTAELSATTRRRVLAAIGGATALTIGATAFVAISGGSATASRDAGDDALALRAAASASAAPSDVVTIPPTYVTGTKRNPFQPLVTSSPTTGAVVPGAPSTSRPAAPSTAPSTPAQPPILPTSSLPIPIATVTVTVTATPTAPAPTATPTPTPSATPTQTALPTAGQAITLTVDSVDLAADTVNATVVNGSSTTQYAGLHVNQVFGTYFKLVTVLSSDPSAPPVVGKAGFEYGDQFVQLGQGESAHLS